MGFRLMLSCGQKSATAYGAINVGMGLVGVVFKDWFAANADLQMLGANVAWAQMPSNTNNRFVDTKTAAHWIKRWLSERRRCFVVNFV
jgi:hypothetical protein